MEIQHKLVMEELTSTFYKRKFNKVMKELKRKLCIVVNGIENLDVFLSTTLQRQENHSDEVNKKLIILMEKNKTNIDNKKNFYLANKDKNILDIKECTVCLTEIVNIYGVLTCQHVFCKECMLKLYLEYHNCPICRAEIKPSDFEFFHKGTGIIYTKGEILQEEKKEDEISERIPISQREDSENISVDYDVEDILSSAENEQYIQEFENAIEIMERRADEISIELDGTIRELNLSIIFLEEKCDNYKGLILLLKIRIQSLIDSGSHTNELQKMIDKIDDVL